MFQDNINLPGIFITIIVQIRLFSTIQVGFPNFRDHITTLGATSLSAGSKTEPGGYFTHPQALEQFVVSDDRTPSEVETAIKKAGYEAVWKDWDRIFD